MAVTLLLSSLNVVGSSTHCPRLVSYLYILSLYLRRMPVYPPMMLNDLSCSTMAASASGRGSLVPEIYLKQNEFQSLTRLHILP